MAIATEQKIWTDEEFMALSKERHRYELVNGEVLDIGNSGMEHGEFGALLAGTLSMLCPPKSAGSGVRFQYCIYAQDWKQAIARCFFCL